MKLLEKIGKSKLELSNSSTLVHRLAALALVGLTASCGPDDRLPRSEDPIYEIDAFEASRSVREAILLLDELCVDEELCPNMVPEIRQALAQDMAEIMDQPDIVDAVENDAFEKFDDPFTVGVLNETESSTRSGLHFFNGLQTLPQVFDEVGSEFNPRFEPKPPFVRASFSLGGTLDRGFTLATFKENPLSASSGFTIAHGTGDVHIDSVCADGTIIDSPAPFWQITGVVDGEVQGSANCGIQVLEADIDADDLAVLNEAVESLRASVESVTDNVNPDEDVFVAQAQD